MAEIKKEDAKKYINSLCEKAAGQIRSCNQVPFALRNSLLKDTGDIISYANNAIESSDPFMQNIEAMRAKGLWMPENINKNNVRAGYFNTARNKVFELYDKIKHTQKIIQSPVGGAICSELIELNNFLERIMNYDII